MDAGEIQDRLDTLRQADSRLGALAEAEASAYRRAVGAPDVPYGFPGQPAYVRCYPSPFVPRTGPARILASLARRFVLAARPVLPVVSLVLGRQRTRVRSLDGWVVFVSPGCVLLRGSIDRLLACGGASCGEFMYGDSVHWDPGDKFDYVHQLRPDWSPERLLSHCYVGGVVVVARRVAEAAGGIGALRRMSPHDRALSLADCSATHAHVDVVLYRSPRSAAMPDIDTTAVERHVARTGLSATVEQREPRAGAFVRRSIPGRNRVCAIIPTMGTVDHDGGSNEVLAARAVRSLLAMDPLIDFEILVVADRVTPQAALRAISDAGGRSVRFIDFDGPFNFARKINLAAVQTDCEHLLLVNDDTEVVTAGTVACLLSVLREPRIGAVAPVLTYDDGTVQSAGHLLNPVPFDMYRGYRPRNEAGWGLLGATREVASLIAAFLLVRRDDFVAVGGLSEQFGSDYNDVDLALKLRMSGKSSVVTPFVTCVHSESKSRKPGLDPVAIAALGLRWQHVLENDPFGHAFLQPHEFVWKSNEDTRASLDAAVGAPVRWDGGEWAHLQTLEDRHLHRTMFFPHRVAPL